MKEALQQQIQAMEAAPVGQNQPLRDAVPPPLLSEWEWSRLLEWVEEHVEGRTSSGTG